VQPLSLPAPPPRYDKEVCELLGDSEHAITERWREIKRQRQKIDVRAYLEDCWDKAGFHEAEVNGIGLDKAMQ